MASTRDCDLFYDASGEAMVLDSENGITCLNSKTPLFEYHVAGRNKDYLDLEKLQYGASWGDRLVQTPTGSYLIFASNLIMPFSYLSVIQHYQEDEVDQAIDQFYIDDYYKIEGQTTLHKFMLNPDKLERIIDCYWEQDPNYITTVLVKEEGGREDAGGLGGAGPGSARNARAGGTEVYQPAQRTTTAHKLAAMLQDPDDDVPFVKVFGKSPIEAQLQMSCDRLVNKMLYYLSKVSVQKSFYSLIPRFSELVEYTRFEDYMDTFFQMTKQMQETTVLYTAKESDLY